MCSGPMAPVMFPAATSRAVRIVSNILLVQERSEIGHRIFGFVKSVWPGFVIGTHFAIFQLGGYVLCWIRLVNSWSSSVGAAIGVAVNIQ